LNISSIPSALLTDGSLPVRSHIEKARRRSSSDMSIMLLPRYLRGENI
jgi:hypothetical protein